MLIIHAIVFSVFCSVKIESTNLNELRHLFHMKTKFEIRKKMNEERKNVNNYWVQCLLSRI